MYVIIVGGGRVGYYLAKGLVEEGHEVLVIERDRQTADRVVEDLGSIVITGDGCEAAVLQNAGAERADALIAVTGDDEDNLVSCQLGKSQFDVPHTIARINNPKNEAIFKALGIDVTISATQVIMEHIQQEFPSHGTIHLMTLRNRGLEVVEVRIPRGAPSIGKRVKDLPLPPESILSLVISATGGPQVPNGDTVLQADDEVVAVTRLDQENALRLALIGS